MIGKGLEDAVFGAIVVAFIAGGAVFAFFFHAIPWLWRLVKPWLHAVTG